MLVIEKEEVSIWNRSHLLKLFPEIYAAQDVLARYTRIHSLNADFIWDWTAIECF